MNVPQKIAVKTQPNASHQQNESKKPQKRQEQCPRFELKNLLFPPGRLTRPKKYVDSYEMIVLERFSLNDT